MSRSSDDDIDVLDAILVGEKHVMRWSYAIGNRCIICGWIDDGTQGQAWMRRNVCPGKLLEFNPKHVALTSRRQLPDDYRVAMRKILLSDDVLVLLTSIRMEQSL
jgi:hypothetical protein